MWLHIYVWVILPSTVRTVFCYSRVNLLAVNVKWDNLSGMKWIQTFPSNMQVELGHKRSPGSMVTQVLGCLTLLRV